MNNFYITISNGLLTPEHRKRMGSAVWEFMWILDKVTKIDDDGIGYVLGGKPVNLKDFGFSHKSTTSENLTRLEKAGYISTTNTPYGIIIRVQKAKKRFNKKSVNEDREDSGKPNGRSEKTKPRSEKTNPNKTVSVDKTEDIGAQDAAEDSDLINYLIREFEAVNPMYERLFKNTTQRAALKRMVKKLGYDQLLSIIRFLPKSNASRYGPTITTPYKLEYKMGDLQAFWKKQKDQITNNKGYVI